MALYLLFLLAFGASLVLTVALLRTATRHAHLSADHDLSGPQKMHDEPVPRIGGVGIYVATCGAAALAMRLTPTLAPTVWLLLLCALPAFGSGLWEDLTKTVRPRWRLAASMVAAALAAWLLDAVVRHTGLVPLDAALAVPAVALALTVLAVAGVTNSVNLIDGFNGLASMCAILMLLGAGTVGLLVGDHFILAVALIVVGATLGFFVRNYPAGLIFLGDGGAYFLGFMVAETLVLLVVRNPEVSPLFAVAVAIYPVFETLFSIYRRAMLRRQSPGEPDGVHLHTLIYRRMVRATPPGESTAMRNALTSPYLWAICALTVAPAIALYNQPWALAGLILLFCATYVLLYWRIVRFRAPRWLVIR